MNAIAAIRHGPIILEVLHETPGSSTTYQPLESMLTIMYGPHDTQPSHTRPFLPPVHILHRSSTNPPHFNATKPIEKKSHIEPEYLTRPPISLETEPPRQLEIETMPPSSAKRPKTSSPPQSPVLPGPNEATSKPKISLGQEMEEAHPGVKRPTVADWDGLNRNQRKKWRKKHN